VGSVDQIVATPTTIPGSVRPILSLSFIAYAFIQSAFQASGRRLTAHTFECNGSTFPAAHKTIRNVIQCHPRFPFQRMEIGRSHCRERQPGFPRLSGFAAVQLFDGSGEQVWHPRQYAPFGRPGKASSPHNQTGHAEARLCYNPAYREEVRQCARYSRY